MSSAWACPLASLATPFALTDAEEDDFPAFTRRRRDMRFRGKRSPTPASPHQPDLRIPLTKSRDEEPNHAGQEQSEGHHAVEGGRRGGLHAQRRRAARWVAQAEPLLPWIRRTSSALAVRSPRERKLTKKPLRRTDTVAVVSSQRTRTRADRRSYSPFLHARAPLAGCTSPYQLFSSFHTQMGRLLEVSCAAPSCEVLRRCDCESGEVLRLNTLRGLSTCDLSEEIWCEMSR